MELVQSTYILMLILLPMYMDDSVLKQTIEITIFTALFLCVISLAGVVSLVIAAHVREWLVMWLTWLHKAAFPWEHFGLAERKQLPGVEIYGERKVQRKREPWLREWERVDRTGGLRDVWCYCHYWIHHTCALSLSLRVPFLPPTVLRQTPQGPLSVALNRPAYFVCACFCV